MQKVLLVDDSNMIRMILKGLLTQLNISCVVEAPNGQEALKILEANKIDLILLDIHMPVMDGPALLTELKKRPEHAAIPVVIISSDSDPAQLELTQQLGARAFIQKPFRLDSLQKALLTAGVL